MVYGFERMLEAHREMCTGEYIPAAKEAYSTARIYHLALVARTAEAHHWTRGKEAYEHNASFEDSDRTAERIAYAFGLEPNWQMNAFAQCDIPPGKYRKFSIFLGNVKMVITMRGPDFDAPILFSGTTPLPEALWAAKKWLDDYWEGKGDPEYAPSEKARIEAIDPNDAKAKEIFYIDPQTVGLANVAFDVPTMKMIGSCYHNVVVGTDLETLALRPDAYILTIISWRVEMTYPKILPVLTPTLLPSGKRGFPFLR
ncbi:hypothetical protein SPFM10_00075 [Salmonella phage SPFM10]|nr:hypothetical protein SPFM10_00075 [Salmonella phage SPFM10]